MSSKHRYPKTKTVKISPVRAKNFSPGTPRYTGKKQKLKTVLDIIDYSKEDYERYETSFIPDIFKYENEKNITWINVKGLNDIEAVKQLGDYFELHPLIQEDIVAIHQRPKIDEYDDFIFMVFKMLQYNDREELLIEHTALVLGKDYVLTFHEAENDVFNDLRERIEMSKGRVRSSGSDYLMFAILDAVVDHYFAVVEFLINKIELVEDRLFEAKDVPDLAGEIQELKKEVLKIRRAVLPLREVINRLDKSETGLVEERTNKYIRDLYDNIIQVSESVEMQREMTASLLEMYLTTINNRMNEVMKVLTIVTSVFIPLTLITGIYGMNFDYMPELHYKYSYFIVLGVMTLIFFVLISFFKRKKWF